jgi:hypothetical protein
MPPPRKLLGLKDFMRRAKVLGLYRSLLRALPPAERPLVRAEFKRHAGERAPALVALRIAEAERQLVLVKKARGTAAPPGADAAPAAALWPWQQG